jgi:hypothetical protein
MSFIRKHSKLLMVASSCAVLGAGVSAIASAGASTRSSSAARTGHIGKRWAARRLAARAVHGDLIVASESGFVTVTFDRGKVQSVDGQQLTLVEGTKTKTYKTVTLTIPAGARVRDNGHKSTLADLMGGQRVIVVQAPKNTFVVAHTAR